MRRVWIAILAAGLALMSAPVPVAGQSPTFFVRAVNYTPPTDN